MINPILQMRKLRPHVPKPMAHLLLALQARVAVDHQDAQRAPREGGARAVPLFLRGSEHRGWRRVRAQAPTPQPPPGASSSQTRVAS